MNRRRFYWAAPLMTAAILLSVYAANGLYPFGTNTISWCDMKQQVIPFLLDLKNIFAGKADLLLNLENAGGMSFWGVFLFFISSPFSFLVLAVPAGQIYLFVNILLLLKIMTCAFTAELWLRRTFPALDAAQVTAISTMYAFSGYAMIYAQNIVWLDVMALFPLLMLGLLRLTSDGKPLSYILALSAILIVNFYLTYMVGIFLILGFGVYLFLCVPKEERGAKTLLFGLSTLASCLLTSVVWLPSLYQYLASARSGSLITNLQAAVSKSNFYTAAAVILCSGAILAAIVCTFLPPARKMESSTRWLITMLVLTLIPVFVEQINRMWHAGSYQAFPVRYGYMPILLGLTLFARCVCNCGEQPEAPGKGVFRRILPILGAAAVVGLVVWSVASAFRLNYTEATSYTRTLWVDWDSFRIALLCSLTFSLAFMIILLLRRTGRLPKRAFSLFLCALTAAEAVFSSGIYVASAANSGYSYSSVLDLSGKLNGDLLDRVKMNEKYFDVNLLGSIGFDTTSHYTSLTAKDYLFSMKRLGYSSYWMEVGSNGGTKLTDAILANRYTVFPTYSLSADADSVYSNTRFSLVENEDVLPFGFVCRNAESLTDLPDGTRFQTQEAIFETLFSSDSELFEEYQPDTLDNVALTLTDHYELTLQNAGKVGTVSYEISVPGTQTLYFDCFDAVSNRLYEHINSAFAVSVNGRTVDASYPTQTCNGFLCLGTFTNETVSVSVTVNRSVYAKSFGVAGLRDDVLTDAISQTTGASLKQSGNSIVGTVSADSDGEYLFLPVSWAKGYSATVNGKSTEVLRVCGTFVAVRLEKGENSITLTYVPQGLLPGLLLSLLGIPLLFLLLRAVKRGSLERAPKLRKVTLCIFLTLFWLVLFAVYVFPLVVYYIV